MHASDSAWPERGTAVTPKTVTTAVRTLLVLLLMATFAFAGCMQAPDGSDDVDDANHADDVDVDGSDATESPPLPPAEGSAGDDWGGDTEQGYECRLTSATGHAQSTDGGETTNESEGADDGNAAQESPDANANEVVLAPGAQDDVRIEFKLSRPENIAKVGGVIDGDIRLLAGENMIDGPFTQELVTLEFTVQADSDGDGAIRARVWFESDPDTANSCRTLAYRVG